MITLDEARREIDEIDRQLSELYMRRMEAVSAAADAKEKLGLPVLDRAREADIIARGTQRIGDESLRPGYAHVLQAFMTASRQVQTAQRTSAVGETVTLIHRDGVCPIVTARGGLDRAGEVFDLDRDVFILTDDGVPARYAQAVAVAAAARPGHRTTIHTIPAGEGSKTPETLLSVLSAMADAGCDRTACVVGVGGGVVCDTAGLAASLYMRGIDHYFVPTTLLCMIDAGIGGKTAVDLGGVKNLIGTFRQPGAVLCDPAVLATLPPRETACGMAEAVKAALIGDEELFRLFESEDPDAHMNEIIRRAVSVKCRIVREDEREGSARRVLNLGHTLGHGIEAAEGGRLEHGECVALGMIPMVSPALRARLVPVLERLGLPTVWRGDRRAALSAIRHDKKAGPSGITAVVVDEIGHPALTPMTPDELDNRLSLLAGSDESIRKNGDHPWI